MEVLSALAIIVTLWGPVKYLRRWLLEKTKKPTEPIQRGPRDFLLSWPELSPDEEHYRLIYHHYPHLAQSRPFIIR